MFSTRSFLRSAAHFFFVSVIAGCSDDAATDDVQADAGREVGAVDSGTDTSTPSDAGSEPSAPRDAGSTDASSTDAGSTDVSVDATPKGADCGRYIVSDMGSSPASAKCAPPTAGCDGSGLVFDTKTGLTWLRNQYAPSGGLTQPAASAYCEGRKMRLPTLAEATEIAKNPSTCAWMLRWTTWTSCASGSSTCSVTDDVENTRAVDPTTTGVANALCVR